MKKNMILAIICLIVLLCGCENVAETNPVEVVTYYQDDSLMEHYGNSYTDYASVEYEQIVVEWQDASGRDSSVGPQEPKYRGVIHLTEEQANRLVEAYDWTDAAPQIGFDTVVYDVTGSENWYSSNEFEENLFANVAIIHVYFNGTDAVIFEIQVM